MDALRILWIRGRRAFYFAWMNRLVLLKITAFSCKVSAFNRSKKIDSDIIYAG